jgi:hypothetical protein
MMIMDETDLADIDLEQLEEALNQKDLQQQELESFRKGLSKTCIVR